MRIKRIVFFLFALTTTFSTLESLSQADYCVLPEIIHKEVKCKQHQCNPHLCSTDENKCKALKGWTYLLGKKEGVIMKTLVLYQKFVPNIKECVNSQYVTMKSEVCNNREACFENIKWKSRLMLKTISVKVRKQCKCTGKHGFDCGNDYCAVDQNTCQIMFEEETFKDIIREIKSCV